MSILPRHDTISGPHDCGRISIQHYSSLQKMLSRAYHRYPFYRDRMDAHKIDLHGDPFENLKKMPLMTSDDYRALSVDALQALGKEIYLVDTSSGTSGSPKRRFLTLQDEYIETEQMLRIFQYAGFEASDRIVFLDIWFPNMYPLFVRAANLLGIKDVFAFGMHNDPMETIRKISELDFTVLITIPSVVTKLFSSISRETDCRAMSNLKKILFFGEGFSNEYKSRIEKLFDIQVYNYYGSTELGCIGCDCSAHEGVHVFEDMFYIELLDEDNNNPFKGELVVTTLLMDGMPLIRYRTKDLVEVDNRACDCGSPFARINLIGRSDDMVSIYGSKYHIHQFDDILTSVMGYLPGYKIKFNEQGESDSENEYVILLVLPVEAEQFEYQIHEKILLLETMEFYVNSNYLKIRFEYSDEVGLENGTRKTDRIEKMISDPDWTRREK